ncbi:hypothetical protein ACFYYI_09980 [Streptomyces sp. NPDC002387]|uniref:Uncharacterized protein n=1 Tax=Streptomyces lannensis TaxID=766498 RepID=A0ABP7JUF1_9ACTN|nr:hypothetical protein [Streptomyces sp. WAC07094]
MSGPACEPLESLPPARRAIVGTLLGHGAERSEVEELLQSFEAELADWLRDQADEVGAASKSFSREFRDGMHFVANCLDLYDGRGVPPERGGRG